MSRLTPKTQDFNPGRKIFIFPDGSFEISEAMELPSGAILGAELPIEGGSYLLLTTLGAFLVKLDESGEVELETIPYKTYNGSSGDSNNFYDGDLEVTQVTSHSLVYESPTESTYFDLLIDRGETLIFHAEGILRAIDKETGTQTWSNGTGGLNYVIPLEDYIFRAHRYDGDNSFSLLDYDGNVVDTNPGTATLEYRNGTQVGENTVWITRIESGVNSFYLVDVSGGTLDFTPVTYGIESADFIDWDYVEVSEDAVFYAEQNWDGNLFKYSKDLTQELWRADIDSGLILFMKYIPSTGNLVVNLYYGEAGGQDYSDESYPTLLEIDGETGAVLRVWRDTEVDDPNEYSYATQAGVIGNTLIYLDDWNDDTTKIIWFDLINWVEEKREVITENSFFGGQMYFPPVTTRNNKLLYSFHMDTGDFFLVDENDVYVYDGLFLGLSYYRGIVPAEEGVYVLGGTPYGIYLLT